MIIFLPETDTILLASWKTPKTCKPQRSSIYAKTIPAYSTIFQCMQKYNENGSNSSTVTLIRLSLCAFIEMIAYKRKLVGETNKQTKKVVSFRQLDSNHCGKRTLWPDGKSHETSRRWGSHVKHNLMSGFKYDVKWASQRGRQKTSDWFQSP